MARIRSLKWSCLNSIGLKAVSENAPSVVRRSSVSGRIGFVKAKTVALSLTVRYFNKGRDCRESTVLFSLSVPGGMQ